MEKKDKIAINWGAWFQTNTLTYLNRSEITLTFRLHITLNPLGVQTESHKIILQHLNGYARLTDILNSNENSRLKKKKKKDDVQHLVYRKEQNVLFF